jgi:hypothetical protein
MSESSFTPTPSHHHIGILMSGAGRFVSCIICHLRFSFPSGAHYDTIAKQFGSYSCSIPLPLQDGAPVESGSAKADE